MTTLETRIVNHSIMTDLAPEARARLTDEELKQLQELSDFKAPYIREKLEIEGKLSSDMEYMEAFTEFKKYVVLSKLNPDLRLGMPSRKVDAVWHQFILFTRHYQEFCDKFLGHYMHHSPKTSFTPGQPEDKSNFLEAYKETFGELHPIWEPQYNNADCWSSDSCVACCRT